MLYRDRIEEMKKKWIGKKVLFEGIPYTVVDVDYNGGLLIDKKAAFTDTTAVPMHMVKEIGSIDFGDLMEMAMERIKPYLPEDYEMDDCSWGDGIFQIKVFYVKDCGNPSAADRLRFIRRAGETDEEVMERFNSEIQKYAEGWRN